MHSFFTSPSILMCLNKNIGRWTCLVRSRIPPLELFDLSQVFFLLCLIPIKMFYDHIVYLHLNIFILSALNTLHSGIYLDENLYILLSLNTLHFKLLNWGYNIWWQRICGLYFTFSLISVNYDPSMHFYEDYNGVGAHLQIIHSNIMDGWFLYMKIS